jgi:prophage regulatory protein
MRLLRFPQLKSEKGIPFCRVHIDRLERGNNFPSRIRLGTNTVAWAEDEVDGWIAARMKAREDRILEPAGMPAPKKTVA